MSTWLLGSALGLLACSSGGGESLGSEQQAASTPFANDQKAFDYFLGKGLTNFQAAAVVGNLDQESGIDPAIHQNNGGVGRGIAQWSAGARWDTTPGDNVLEYAKQQGKSELSLDLQLDFVWYELTKFPEYGLTELKASGNVNDATQVFEDKFEGCVYANYPECALPSRQNFAKGALDAYGNDVVAPSGGAGGMGGMAGNGNGGGGAAAGGTGGAAGGAGGAPVVGGGAGAGGTPSSAGAPAMAGAPTGGGGTPSTGSGGVLTTAGASTAGAAGTPTFGAATTSDSGGCSVSRPSRGSASWLLSALVLGFAAARRKRRR